MAIEFKNNVSLRTRDESTLIVTKLNVIPNGGLLYADDLVHETPVSSNGRAEDVVQETPASSNVRKTRGTTLMTRIWSLPANLKIECELNVRGQPIGESGQTFTRWLGTFCLSHALCPLVLVAWTRVPQKNKLDCWIEIEKRWIIDPEIIQPANQMSWALHLLGELRRNRRTKLKKKCYLPNALKEEVIGKIPRWADEQDYAALVDYWFLPSTKTLIDKNKSSRGFQKDIARSGPISFAQTADKMAKESGQAVERATLFAKVYSTKDGAPVSTAVKEKIDKMTAILNNGCTLHGERRDGILWAKDDAFAQVIGAERSGRVRGVGFGPTPSGRSGSNLPCYTSTPLSSTETANRMTSLENSHQSLRDELAQSEQRHKEEVAEIHAKHKEEIAEALAEAKRQSDAQHKEQLAEAKRQFDAQHRVQMEDMMSSLKAALDHLSPDLSTLGYSGLFKVKADKHSARACFQHHGSSPRTPIYEIEQASNSLIMRYEMGSFGYGEMRLIDFSKFCCKVGICELPFHSRRSWWNVSRNKIYSLICNPWTAAPVSFALIIMLIHNMV
ncbi:hypothetical protein SO802_027806 [Lithocarpus litseifolius]|uniref:Uncharacterized protein n=1 Tax=Lithocarpus litseifolius TaxID=425828 RepID=A0AAW2BP84_9ROSI